MPKQGPNYQLRKIIHMVDLDVLACFYNVFLERIFISGDSIGYISQNLNAERAVNRQPGYRTGTLRADMLAEP